MSTRRTILVVALALLVAPAAAVAVTPRTGAFGIVHAAQGGACLEGDPCDGRARGVVIAFTKPGGIAHRVRTGAEGTFRIALRPGRYRITAPGFEGRVSPSYVTVPRTRFVRVDVGLTAPRIP